VPEDVTGSDRRYAELRAAVDRLMAFRQDVLRRSLFAYRDGLHYAANTVELRHFNDPVWHRLEEVLK